MPKLLAVLNDAAYNAVDDSLKTFYVQNAETKDWWLDVDDPGKLDVAGKTAFDNLKTKLDGAFRERDAALAKVKPFEALGKSAEEIQAALIAKQPEDVKAVIAKHETEMENLRKSFEPITAVNEKLKAQVAKSLTDAAISKVATEFNLDPETAPAILRDYIKAVPVAEGSDEYVPRVFLNNEPALVAGQPMTAEQLVKSFQEGKKYSGMFLVGNGSGPGGIRQATHSGNQIVLDRESVKSNPQMYKDAKAEAAKSGKTVVFNSSE